MELIFWSSRNPCMSYVRSLPMLRPLNRTQQEMRQNGQNYENETKILEWWSPSDWCGAISKALDISCLPFCGNEMLSSPSPCTYRVRIMYAWSLHCRNCAPCRMTLEYNGYWSQVVLSGLVHYTLCTTRSKCTIGTKCWFHHRRLAVTSSSIIFNTSFEKC